MTFAFDDQFAMFDVTPVENQFILEYLPGARGDYVRVYLYGLFCCYHPQKEMNLDSMSHDLNLPMDDIIAAFRYWERRGIVRRIQDHPPQWQYINIKQKSLYTDDVIDPEYAAFSKTVMDSFDGIRVFHGSEIASCYEWKEDLQLPTEVILMLLKHMARVRGKNFRIADAQKLAIRLADEKARSIEEAEYVLSMDESAMVGMKKVLRKLGKKYTPSEAQMSLYRKWTETWGFDQEAIESACDQTGTADPDLNLVNAILEKTWEQQGQGKKEHLSKSDVQASGEIRKIKRKVMKELGLNTAMTPYQEELYQRMASLYPDPEIILIAARECGRRRKDPESAYKLLQSWQKRGFTTQQEIESHIRSFQDRESFLKEVKSRWSDRTDIGEKSLEQLEKWENQLGISRELILKAADYASEAKKPMAYMDALLVRYAEKGIHTPEEAERDHQENAQANRKQNASPTSGAQQYHQRDYAGEQEEAMKRFIRMNGGNGNA